MPGELSDLLEKESKKEERTSFWWERGKRKKPVGNGRNQRPAKGDYVRKGRPQESR